MQLRHAWVKGIENEKHFLNQRIKTRVSWWSLAQSFHCREGLQCAIFLWTQALGWEDAAEVELISGPMTGLLLQAWCVPFVRNPVRDAEERLSVGDSGFLMDIFPLLSGCGKAKGLMSAALIYQVPSHLDSKKTVRDILSSTTNRISKLFCIPMFLVSKKSVSLAYLARDSDSLAASGLVCVRAHLCRWPFTSFGAPRRSSSKFFWWLTNSKVLHLLLDFLFMLVFWYICEYTWNLQTILQKHDIPQDQHTWSDFLSLFHLSTDIFLLKMQLTHIYWKINQLL